MSGLGLKIMTGHNSGHAGCTDVHGRTLPPALELLTAWSIGENGEAEFFDQALDRAVADALRTDDPTRNTAEILFGLSTVAGLLLEELASATGRTHSQVLNALHNQHVVATQR
jgi:hypothetical protein